MASTCLPGISLERGCIFIAVIMVVRGLVISTLLFLSYVTLRKTSFEWDVLLALGPRPDVPAVIYSMLTLGEFAVNYYIIRRSGQKNRLFLLLWLCEYTIYSVFLFWLLMRVFRSGRVTVLTILQALLLLIQISFVAVYSAQYRQVCKARLLPDAESGGSSPQGRPRAQVDGVANHGMVVADEGPPTPSRDLPPTYDQCLSAEGDKRPLPIPVFTRTQSQIERLKAEPPPPYSDCVFR